jgi:capsular polysaccharide transport system permease protein
MSFRDEVALTLRGARMQRRVIGALIIRELHSRFGQHYYGYIWLFFEPLLLGAAIGFIHLLRDHPARFGPFEFYAIGYVLYFIFRGVVNRASVAIRSNMQLLYHRTVTLPDVFLARHIIEAMSCTGVMVVFLFALFVVNGELVEDPTKIILALIGMTLLSQGFAFLAAAATEAMEGLERGIHAITYLILPICGMFFLVEWLPDWLQELALWVPTVHLFELMRDGQFGSRFLAYYDLGYVAAWILVTHLLGLAALRITRQRIGLE